jgi:hypothetical protein
VGPAGKFQRGGALRLGTKLFDKRGQRQTGLKLDAIHGHDQCLVGWGKYPVCAVTVTKTGLAEEAC